MLDAYEKHSKRKFIATVLSVMVIAGAIVFSDNLKRGNNSVSSTNKASNTSAQNSPASASRVTSATSTTSAVTRTTPNVTASPTASRSSSFTASSDYYVPHGTESIQVSLTVGNGVITEASIQNSGSNRQSGRYQDDFTSAYKSYVVGKKISGLKLGIIAGASDTTQGFNDALNLIATKVQS